MPHLHVNKPEPCRTVWRVFQEPFAVISMGPNESWCNWWMKATRQESLHLEKHDDGASHWTEGTPPTKGQALRKLGVSGIWHWCWVLIMLSFSIPGPQREKAWQCFRVDLHVEGSWISDQPPPPPPPSSLWHIRTNPYIHSNLPSTLGDLHCGNSCQGNSLSQRESEKVREGALGRGKVISFWKNTARPSLAKS